MKTSEQPRHDDKPANTANAVDMKTPSVLQELDLCCPSDKQPFASHPKERNAIKSRGENKIYSYDTLNKWHFVHRKRIAISTNVELKDPPTKNSLDEELEEGKIFVACPAIDREADRWTKLARMPAQIEEKLSDEDKKTIAKAREQFLPDTTPVNIIQEGFFSSAIKFINHPMFPALLLVGFFVVGFIFAGVFLFEFLTKFIRISWCRDLLGSETNNINLPPTPFEKAWLPAIQNVTQKAMSIGASYASVLLSLEGRLIYAIKNSLAESTAATLLSFCTAQISSFIWQAERIKHDKQHACMNALHKCRNIQEEESFCLQFQSRTNEDKPLRDLRNDQCLQSKRTHQMAFRLFEINRLNQLSLRDTNLLDPLSFEKGEKYCKQNLKECSDREKKSDRVKKQEHPCRLFPNDKEKDKKFFSQVKVNSDIGTICWDNGADISPTFLHENIHIQKKKKA